jgi:hypothetical protein
MKNLKIIDFLQINWINLRDIMSHVTKYTLNL